MTYIANPITITRDCPIYLVIYDQNLSGDNASDKLNSQASLFAVCIVPIIAIVPTIIIITPNILTTKDIILSTSYFPIRQIIIKNTEEKILVMIVIDNNHVFLYFVVRSAQVYTSIIDNADVVFNALNILSSDDRERYPRIEGLRRRGDGDIQGSIHTRVIHRNGTSDRFTTVFLFRLQSHYLYLVGHSDARDNILSTLNGLQGMINSISTYEITKNHLVDTLLARLRTQHTTNFIKKINMMFGINGINYHNNTPLYKLDYELIQNTCVTSHESFRQFIDSAELITVKFGIRSFYHINRTEQSDSPAPMNMNLLFGVSLYFESSDVEWFAMLDFLTGRVN